MLSLDSSHRMDRSCADADVASNVVTLSERELEHFRRFIHEHAGISLAPHKRQLVSARLQRKLRQLGLQSFKAYLDLLDEPGQGGERQALVDLLTTNETYFYREPAHFEYLQSVVLPSFRGRRLRVWSAACSSGEEVYTLAMVLAETLGSADWDVLGTDISTRVLEQARRGLYPSDRAKHLRSDWLTKYCLKGVRSQAGNLLVDAKLRTRVRFAQHNLLKPLPPQQRFEIVFLRNVLIYFDHPTKQRVISVIGDTIAPGGYLIISHVESLHGIRTELEMARPSIFRKPIR